MRYDDRYLNSDFGLGDTPLTSMGGGFKPSTAGVNAFANVGQQNADIAAGIAGAGIEAASNRQIARMYAEQREKQQRSKGAGGFLRLATPIVSAINPVAGAVVGGIGGFFG